MFKDDRMMSMLTFLVVMIALGTVIQRVDFFERLIDGETGKRELLRDDVITRANVLTLIDVLANDTGVDPDEARSLIVAQQPECGRAFVKDGVMRYLPAERCVGSQSILYAISGRNHEETGEVVVVVHSSDPTPRGVATGAQQDVPARTPMAPRAAEGQVATAPTPQSLQPSPFDAASNAVPAAPAAPRPQTPSSAPRPGAPAGGAEAFGNGAPALSGIGQEDSRPAPQLTAPADGLAAASGTTGAPAALQPGRAAPAQPAPVQPPIESDSAPAPAALAPTSPTPSAAAPVAPVPVTPAPVAPPAESPVDRQSEGSALPPAGDWRRASPGADTSTTEANTALGDDAAPRIGLGDSSLDAGVTLSALPQIGAAAAATDPGSGAPGDALAALRTIDQGAAPAPVDTVPPAPLAAPAAPGDTGQPAVQQPGAGSNAAPAPTGTPNAPPAPQLCTLPPAVILDVQPAAVTEVILDAPCQANGVAELSYDGLRFAVAIDSTGAGSVAAVGLQRAADATVRFAEGETMAFNIPFKDAERMDRVALVWDQPVDLELHAFEFGADPESGGHVRPDQPRSFAEVRREGGGYLIQYRPAGGTGQQITVYTFWRRHGGPSEVIKLKLDFASRGAGGAAETCGSGALAEPEFTVLRALAGELERPQRRRLAALDCAEIAAIEDRYIGDAADDLIVLRK